MKTKSTKIKEFFKKLSIRSIKKSWKLSISVRKKNETIDMVEIYKNIAENIFDNYTYSTMYPEHKRPKGVRFHICDDKEGKAIRVYADVDGERYAILSRGYKEEHDIWTIEAAWRGVIVTLGADGIRTACSCVYKRIENENKNSKN